MKKPLTKKEVSKLKHLVKENIKLEKKSWTADAIYNKKKNSISVITYESKKDIHIYHMLFSKMGHPNYEIIKVKITRI